MCPRGPKSDPVGTPLLARAAGACSCAEEQQQGGGDQGQRGPLPLPSLPYLHSGLLLCPSDLVPCFMHCDTSPVLTCVDDHRPVTCVASGVEARGGGCPLHRHELRVPHEQVHPGPLPVAPTSSSTFRPMHTTTPLCCCGSYGFSELLGCLEVDSEPSDELHCVPVFDYSEA